jgi:hypothetical protein
MKPVKKDVNNVGVLTRESPPSLNWMQNGVTYHEIVP